MRLWLRAGKLDPLFNERTALVVTVGHPGRRQFGDAEQRVRACTPIRASGVHGPTRRRRTGPGHLHLRREATPPHKTEQNYVTCNTCWPGDDSTCVCLSCAAKCHSGHDLGPIDGPG
ncbi:hypothetical protein Pelo_3400 [Pelomyxa schiedti]|nr:hypothetical protein Pelo_3400 [Pelomyxa schiedti]